MATTIIETIPPHGNCLSSEEVTVRPDQKSVKCPNCGQEFTTVSGDSVASAPKPR